jgi:hypothetical protein
MLNDTITAYQAERGERTRTLLIEAMECITSTITLAGQVNNAH